MRPSLVPFTPCLLLLLAGCSKQEQPSQPPANVGQVQPTPAPPAPAEAQPEKGPKDVISVATFNLQWAHDHLGDATGAAKKARAKDEVAWKWKVAEVAKILAAQAPDIVALQELGGEDEVVDIIAAIKDNKGPEYEFAFVKSEDPFSGHQLAILSTYPLSDARRLGIHLRRHVAVNVELPDDQRLTVVAIHAPEGQNADASRQKQVKALRRAVEGLWAKNPVVVLGTLGAPVEPRHDGYASSPAGLLAGRATKSEDDDCFDAVDVGVLVSTTRNGEVVDSIYACGVEMVEAASHEEGIVRGSPDDANKAWSEIPADKSNERDVSDHFLVVANVKRPAPAPAPEEKGAKEGEPSQPVAKN